MANVRALVYTIRVTTDKGVIVKAGTDFDKLEDDLWALYEAELCPFAPDQDEEEDDDGEDDAGIELDEEFDSLSEPASDETPPKDEE